MRLRITIDPRTLAADTSNWSTTEQAELIVALLCEADPEAIAKSLGWIGSNGCGYGVCVPVPAKDREAAAISAFITACYQRHDKGTTEGDAIRAAIHTAITDGDKKDNQ